MKLTTVWASHSKQGEETVNRKQAVLLVVEDDRDMRSLLCDELWDLGCRIVEAADGDEALEQIAENHPDVILTDLRMPAGGLDYVVRLRTLAPFSPIILMTAFGDAHTRAEAVKHGVVAYFDKPMRLGVLKTVVRRTLEGDGGKPSSISDDA